jgi:hypothetical protein
MGDWTTDLLFKPDVAMVMGYKVNEKQGNHDKSALDHRMEKENEEGKQQDSVNIGKEKT